MVDGQPVSLYFDARKTSRLRVGKKDGVWKDDSEGIFVVDWSTSPARLDIEWGKLGKIQTVIDQTDDILKVESLTPGIDRPKHFTDKATVLKRDKVKDAQSVFGMFEYQIGTYWLSHSKIPPSLQALIDAKLVVAEDVVDPWGQPYQYDPTGKRNEGNPYSIFSVPGRIYKIRRPDIWAVTPDKRILGNWPEDEKERIADQLACYEILAGSFLNLGSRGNGKGVKDFAIVRISCLDEPIEFKYARCLSISQNGDIDIERPTFNGLVKAMINLDTAVLDAGLKQPKFAEVFVKSRVLAKAAEDKDEIRKSFDEWEVRYNDALTAADAAKFLRAAALIDSVTTKEHQETRKQLRDQILKRLADDPEAVKQLAAAEPSDDLRKSRERVKELIEKAKKK